MFNFFLNLCCDTLYCVALYCIMLPEWRINFIIIRCKLFVFVLFRHNSQAGSCSSLTMHKTSRPNVWKKKTAKLNWRWSLLGRAGSHFSCPMGIVALPTTFLPPNWFFFHFILNFVESCMQLVSVEEYSLRSSSVTIFGSRPSDHYFRSFCLSVCLCRVFLSRLWSDFDQTWTYVISLGLVVSPRIYGLCDSWGLGDP